MTIGKNDVANLTRGRTTVLGPDGDKIGTVSQVYTSDDTGEPTWATVKTGLFGAQETFVPLRDANVAGDDLRVPYDKDTIKDAPRMDPDGHLTLEQEDELYRYYSVEQTDQSTTADREAGRRSGEQPDVYAGSGTPGVSGGRTDPGDRTIGDRDADDDSTRRALRSDGTSATDDDTSGARGIVYPTNGDNDSGAAQSRDSGYRDAGDRDDSAAGGRDLTEGGERQVTPGERTTRLRRFVVTERVVQSVHEVPDEEGTD